MTVSPRRILVTGGASGLGHGIAAAFRDAGDEVIIGDVNADAAALVAAELGATALPLDIADPGAGHIFDEAVYDRGAMVLAALGNRIGPAKLGTLLRTWVAAHHDGNAAVEQFEALAESVSGEDLDGFFAAWLSARTVPPATAANGLAGVVCG